jgi:hypothetical protein
MRVRWRQSLVRWTSSIVENRINAEACRFCVKSSFSNSVTWFTVTSSARVSLWVSREMSRLILSMFLSTKFYWLKITANQECCRIASLKDKRDQSDVQILEDIMMQLMKKRSRGKESISAIDLSRWSSTIASFLSETTSASAEKLTQVS